MTLHRGCCVTGCKLTRERLGLHISSFFGNEAFDCLFPNVHIGESLNFPQLGRAEADGLPVNDEAGHEAGHGVDDDQLNSLRRAWNYINDQESARQPAQRLHQPHSANIPNASYLAPVSAAHAMLLVGSSQHQQQRRYPYSTSKPARFGARKGAQSYAHACWLGF